MNQGLRLALNSNFPSSKAATTAGLGHQVWPRNHLYCHFGHSLSCCVLHSLCACHFSLSFPLLISLPVLFVLLSIQVCGVYTFFVEFSSVSQAETLPLPDFSLPLNFPTPLSSPSTVLRFQKDPPRLSLSPTLFPSVGLGVLPPIAPTVWSVLALYLLLTVVNLNMPSHAH